MNTVFDVLVVGCGGVGSAALYSLASRGLKVAGIDRYSPPHVFGSSHGQTRAIRKAYFEHPDYVPLLHSAYELWKNLEQESQEKLLHLVGVLEAGPADGVLIEGVRNSAKQHDLLVDTLSPEEARKQFPGLWLDESFDCVFESDAGYLLVEQCISSYLQLARLRGAQLLTNTTVHEWSASSSGVEVSTSAGTLHCGSLVLAGGPWSADLVGDITGASLQLKKKHMYWFANDNKQYLASCGFPVFAIELSQDRIYYGFPQIDADGVKLAEHTGGEPANSPDELRPYDDPDADRTAQFRKTHLPNMTGDVKRHEACLYTLSHDENFYLDTHPLHANVAFVSGLSGHGFKFAPVLGEALSDLVTKGITHHNTDFLRVNASRR